VIAKSSLDDLHDDLYVLACAVDDTEADLHAAGQRPSATELSRILGWLLEAAKPLRSRELPAPPPTHQFRHDEKGDAPGRPGERRKVPLGH